MPRLRLRLSFTEISPVLASVTAARPELQPGAARRAFNFGRAAQNLLDAGQHPIGFGERRACRHDVVEDEPALVHLRQQIGAEQPIAAVGRDDDAGRW